jgi:hypothetical protein
VTDGYSDVEESNYANNLAAIPITLNVRPPDLATFAWLVPPIVTSTPWPAVTLIAGVTNQGTGAALPRPAGWADAIYLSTTPFLTDYAYPIITWSRTNPVPPGASYWVTNTVTLPIADSAIWYLVFNADDGNSVGDSNPQNNSAVAPVVFDLAPPGDLAALELDAPSVVTGSADLAFSVAWHVSNEGLGPVAGHWADTLYLSPSPTAAWPSQPILTVPVTNSLLAGAGYWQSNTISLGLTQSASVFLVLQANSDRSVFETDLDDNLIARQVRFEFDMNSVLRIRDARFLPDGSFQLAVFGAVGGQFALQASTNLLDWVVVSNFTIVSLPSYVADPQVGQFQRRFYRLTAVAPALPPSLTLIRSGVDTVVVSWPSPSTGWLLQQNTNDLEAANWNTVTSPILDDGATKTLIITPPVGTGFYRLLKP